MKDDSGTIAMERLRIMMHHENEILDEDTMDSIRSDIENVITRYVDINPDQIEIKVILRNYKKREQNV